MNKTKIEWVKNPDGTQGYTHNSISGCRNHTTEGLCLGGMFPCYAFKLANGRLKPLYLANKNFDLPFPQGGEYGVAHLDKALHDPFYPRFWEERMNEMMARYTQLQSCITFPPRRGVFVCDMGDLFGIGVPELWTNRVIDAIRWNGYDRFYLLTKQPQNLIKFSPFPDNCFVGVTATNELAYVEAVASLANIEAEVKFISFEPLLERIRNTGAFMKSASINWLIIGACTGTEKALRELPGLTLMPRERKWTAQPRIEWVREIVEAADKAGIPVFLKDNLEPLFKQIYDGQDYYSLKYRKGLRQEIPG